jgi:hypothetical protein
MRRLVSTLSPEVALLLERNLMKRSDLHLVTARSIEELVTYAREGAELCLVEPLLPDGDAVDALDAVRGAPGGGRLPIVLVVTADAPAADGDGFSAVLTLPAADDEVEGLLSRLLGEPRRRDLRRAAAASVRDAAGAPLGRLVDLSRGGLALRTRKPMAAGETVALSLELPLQTTALGARARVLRVAGEHVALALDQPEPALTDALDLLVAPPPDDEGLAFRPLPKLGERAAAIGGPLVDGPARAALEWFMSEPKAGAARLVVADLLPFDEAALDRWQTLVQAITPLELYACPPWLRALADRAPRVLGDRARIASLRVAVRCPACSDEHERETALPAGDRAAQVAAVEAAAAEGCFICGAPLELVEPSAAMLVQPAPQPK